MRKLPIVLAVLLISLIALALVAPHAVREYWQWRAANPVRRGLAIAQRMGCFSCHGPLGTRGLPDPGTQGGAVPAWTHGEWTAFVDDAAGVAEYVRRGSALRREAPAAAKPSRARGSIEMPAYAGRMSDGEIRDVVAAFLVVSGMSRPPEGSTASHGYEIAGQRGCFACHGPGGSGGLPNPGSLAGFVPGWYGGDFTDLVNNRDEFNSWIRDGGIARIDASWFGSKAAERQAIRMPRYQDLSSADLEALWDYTVWLGLTGGGVEPDLERLKH